jgi:hypothetical protein
MGIELSNCCQEMVSNLPTPIKPTLLYQWKMPLNVVAFCVAYLLHNQMYYEDTYIQIFIHVQRIYLSHYIF